MIGLMAVGGVLIVYIPLILISRIIRKDRNQ